MKWGRIAASWAIATVLVAAVFVLLAAGEFLGGVAVALLWVPDQAAVLLGLVCAARFPAGSARRTD